MKETFHKFSLKISSLAGTTSVFILAIIGVLIWVISGPYFHFSNTWLAVISAVTDAVIFIMVFSLQNTQNRDSKAIQLKLNELIHADNKARNEFVGLEELTDQELVEIDNEFKKILASVDPNHPLYKLHKKISDEKKSRFDLPKQAGRIVETLLSPFKEDIKSQK